MNNRQISVYSSNRRVGVVLNKYPDVTEILPGFSLYKASFELLQSRIGGCGNQQETNIGGLRTQKETQKALTGQQVMDLACCIAAYALITGDLVLAKKVQITEKAYMRYNDFDFMSTNNVVFSLAVLHQDPLVEYLVTPERLAETKVSIDAYGAMADAPKAGITGRKMVTDLLVKLFEEQHVVLGKLDALYEMLRHSHPAVYTDYREARRIMYRSGSFSVVAEVKDAATGKGIVGVKAAFSLGGVPVLEKLTRKGGGADIKSLAPGVYSVTLSRIGYTTQTVPLNVSGNELVTLRVSLVASPNVVAI